MKQNGSIHGFKHLSTALHFRARGPEGHDVSASRSQSTKRGTFPPRAKYTCHVIASPPQTCCHYVYCISRLVKSRRYAFLPTTSAQNAFFVFIISVLGSCSGPMLFWVSGEGTCLLCNHFRSMLAFEGGKLNCKMGLYQIRHLDP